MTCWHTAPSRVESPEASETSDSKKISITTCGKNVDSAFLNALPGCERNHLKELHHNMRRSNRTKRSHSPVSVFAYLSAREHHVLRRGELHVVAVVVVELKPKLRDAALTTRASVFRATSLLCAARCAVRTRAGSSLHRLPTGRHHPCAK